MLLSEVIYKVAINAMVGSADARVLSVQIDSRYVTNGALFIAIKGDASDGHSYIESAIEKGALAIVCEKIPADINPAITYIGVASTSEAAGVIAANFYGNPSERLKVVGVTGTNGKTTIATLLYKLFTQLGWVCGLVGTVEILIDGAKEEATHTTPDAVSLQKLLGKMLESGCEYVFMEVSSHAIHQQRIAGIQFAGGIFSNITHDHLDYHKTFDAYIAAKKKFFDNLSRTAFALSNADDKRGEIMLQNTAAKKYLYGLKSFAAFKGKVLENVIAGLVMLIGDTEVHFRLIGEFNAYNLLAVYGTAISLGADKEQVLRILSQITGAEGRFEVIVSEKEKVIGIIDYAHTPDALMNVLSTIKKIKQGYETVITVVGCGGDRDKTKRPAMAEVACNYSDKVIFTSDNPRSEDAQAIIASMEMGLPLSARRKYVAIVDRKEAIKAAVMWAQPGDIVLVAGKGHEKYQDIKGVKHHFDDKEVVTEWFNILEK